MNKATDTPYLHCYAAFCKENILFEFANTSIGIVFNIRCEVLNGLKEIAWEAGSKTLMLGAPH